VCFVCFVCGCCELQDEKQIEYNMFYLQSEIQHSVIMFMRPDFTSAILFLCELFFWLKDNVWLQRMCALLKLLAERVPAIMPGCVICS
jgi:hypothetical protein